MNSGSTAFPAHACPRCGGYHTAREGCAPESSGTAAVPPPSEPAPLITPHPRVEAPPADVPHTISLPLAPPAPVAARPRRAGFERIVLAWWGGALGTLVLIICLTTAGIGIADLTVPDADIGAALTTIGISVAVGVLLGMYVMYVSARRYAKMAFAALALVLVSSGAMMMVFAPVLRQMNSPDIAEYRAFGVLLWGGAFVAIAGLALAALCARWAAEREARRWLARRSRRLGFIAGLLQGVVGVIAVVASLVALWASDSYDASSMAQEGVGVTAIGALLLLPALVLVYAGFRGARGKISPAFRPPAALLGVAAFALALALGVWAADAEHAVAISLLHLAAGAIPGIALVAMAARGSLLRGALVSSLTRRQVLLAAAISMTLGVWFAIYFELIGGFAAVVVLLIRHGAFEGASTSDDVFTTIGDAVFILSRNEQFVANLISAAVLAPLFEEFGKALGVRFLMRPNMGRAQAFVLGAAAGAGFGFLESQLYGLAVVEEDLGDWWLIMLVRGGSTSLHVLNTGLVGLAWWYWSFGRRPRVAGALFGTAVGVHALWNGFAVTLYSRIFGLETLSDRAIEIIAYAVVAAVSIAMIAAIPLIARRLRDRPVASATPLASMSPWLA